MATMRDLPTELQAKIWSDFIQGTGVWKERFPRITVLRLVSKRFSTQLLCDLCISTFMAEMERRKDNRATWTHDHMEIAIKSQIGQDAVVKKLYMAMALDTDGKSAFAGLKVLARVYDNEEALLRQCAAKLERGESLDGIVI